jgi:hypothetical protein
MLLTMAARKFKAGPAKSGLLANAWPVAVTGPIRSQDSEVAGVRSYTMGRRLSGFGMAIRAMTIQRVSGAIRKELLDLARTSLHACPVD